MSATTIPPITGINANINGNQYFSNQVFLGSDSSELFEVAWGEWLKDAKLELLTLPATYMLVTVDC